MMSMFCCFSCFLVSLPFDLVSFVVLVFFLCSFLFHFVIVLSFPLFFLLFLRFVFPCLFSTCFDFLPRWQLHHQMGESQLLTRKVNVHCSSVSFVCGLLVVLREAVPTRCAVLSDDGRCLDLWRAV